MKKAYVWIFALLLVGCGGRKEAQEGIYTILFDPNPATLSGGICTSDLTILGDTDYSVVLETSQATIKDSNDESNQASYMDNDFEALFGSVFLAQAGRLAGELSVDGASRGMSAGFTVTYVIIGSATIGYPRQWIGYLECVE